MTLTAVLILFAHTFEFVLSPLYTKVLFSVSSKDISKRNEDLSPRASANCFQMNTAMFSPVL